MAPGRFMTLLFGAVLALAADNASAAQPCVVVSDVSSSVPCPCVGGENGVTLGFTLANGRHHPGFPQQSRHKQQARNVKHSKIQQRTTESTLLVFYSATYVACSRTQAMPCI